MTASHERVLCYIENRYHVVGNWPAKPELGDDLVETFARKADALRFAERNARPDRYGRTIVLDSMHHRDRPELVATFPEGQP